MSTPSLPSYPEGKAGLNINWPAFWLDQLGHDKLGVMLPLGDGTVERRAV